jgi:glycosyltransferase involved in cell wall biosynthesis
MTIGIEAERANNQHKTGVEHYAKQVILHLAEIDSTNQYILFLRTKPEDWFFKLPKNFKVKVMPFPIFWTQIRLSIEMLFNPVDVLFIPASALPLIHPRRSVVTIHDVAWKYFPKSFTWFMRNFLEWSTKFAVKNASNIIAVSESTKRDLVKFYGVDGKKTSVIHHGYERQDKSEEKKEIRIIQQPYILFLSTLQPRKNLIGLIEAFKDLKKENPEIPHKLVVVGRPGWKFEKILEDINRNKDIVTYLNHVSDVERFNILAKADLLVLPSFYEGFGMQILEAFEMDVPVATSKVSSMPEVAGEAAVYFDPHNKAEMKNAIKSVLLDKSLADKLRQKGRERLKEFSWQKCAEQTLKVFVDNENSRP